MNSVITLWELLTKSQRCSQKSQTITFITKIAVTGCHELPTSATKLKATEVYIEGSGRGPPAWWTYGLGYTSLCLWLLAQIWKHAKGKWGRLEQHLSCWNPLHWCWSSSFFKPSSSIHGVLPGTSSKPSLLNFLSPYVTTCSRTFCTCSSYISKSNSSQLEATAVVTNEWESKIAVPAEEDWAPCCSSSPTSGSENLPLCVRDDPISVLCTSSETFPATSSIAPTRAVVLRVTLALFSSPPFSIASCCASLPHTLTSSSVQTTAHFVITG